MMFYWLSAFFSWPFGSDVFPAKPQAPFLAGLQSSLERLGLLMQGLSRLHAGSVILSFFHPSLWMEMGLEIRVVTHRIRVPRLLQMVVGGGR